MHGNLRSHHLSKFQPIPKCLLSTIADYFGRKKNHCYNYCTYGCLGFLKKFTICYICCIYNPPSSNFNFANFICYRTGFLKSTWWYLSSETIKFLKSYIISQKYYFTFYPVSWGCRIHQLHFCRKLRLPKKCPGYDIKPLDSESPVLEF